MEVMAARPSINIKVHNSVGSALPYVSLPLFMETNTNTQQEEQQQESMHPSIANHEEEEEEVSSESSSIGQEDQSSSEDDDEEQVEDEVQSKFKKPLIMSLNSIQEALPIKRGLSNHYNGKSKSFACLSDVMNGKSGDLVKHENPFNKRRRILMVTSRRASYNSLLIQAHNNNNSSSCSSLPPLMLSSNFTLEEEKGDDDDDHNDKLPLEGSSTSSSSSSLAPLSLLDTKAFNKSSFKSPRSFSLSDLQHV